MKTMSESDPNTIDNMMARMGVVIDALDISKGRLTRSQREFALGQANQVLMELHHINRRRLEGCCDGCHKHFPVSKLEGDNKDGTLLYCPSCKIKEHRADKEMNCAPGIKLRENGCWNCRDKQLHPHCSDCRRNGGDGLEDLWGKI